jgi:hypothetical protein
MSHGGVRAELDEDDLGGHAEAHGKPAAPEAARYDDVAALLDDVAIGVALAEARGHHRAANDREAALAAMGMAGKRQADPVGYGGKDVRLVRKQHHRGVAVDLGEQAGQVSRLAKRPWPR